MSWRNVPRKENYFPLFAEDWNALVDAVDDLYYMLHTLPPPPPSGPLVGGYLYGDIIPWLDLYYSLGDPKHRFLNVWAKNIYADPIWTTLLYASNNIFVNDKPVLKDGDPISIYDIQSQAQNVLSNIIQQYVTGPTNIYKEQIMKQLVTIQSLLQNTNTLINSHLARELYETYSYMFQFNYPSGVLQLFSPKPGYQSIIRGWYVVSTGTGGIANIISKYSLTPVGFIPLSIPTLSFPNMSLGLYYDEPLLLYYDNVIQGTYLQLMLSILQQWIGVSVNHPSDIDPAPFPAPVGWDVFFDFLDPSEVQYIMWSGSQVSTLEINDNMLTLRGIQDGEGWFEYDNHLLHSTLIVTTFRLRDVTGNIPYDIVNYWIESLGKFVYISLYGGTLNPDGTITTTIYDYNSRTTLVSNITLRQGEWYVFIYDLLTNTVKLLDKQGNILAQATPLLSSSPYNSTSIYFDLTSGIHTIDIDWIGISQAYPSGIDPDNYKPSTGWIRFFNFLTYDEIKSSSWRIDVPQEIKISHSIVTLRGYPGTVPSFQYYLDGVNFNTVAVTFRIRDMFKFEPHRIMSVYIQNSSIGSSFFLDFNSLNPDGTITFRLIDNWGGKVLTENLVLKQGEWYVLSYSLTDKTLQIKDSHGNVIYSTQLTTLSTTSGLIDISFHQTDGIHTLDIDWIGMG